MITIANKQTLQRNFNSKIKNKEKGFTKFVRLERKLRNNCRELEYFVESKRRELNTEFDKTIKDSFFDCVRIRKNYIFHFSYSKINNVSYCEHYDRRGYSNSCDYGMTTQIINFQVNYNDIKKVNNANILNSDGIMTIKINSEKIINGITIYLIDYIKQRKGTGFEVSKTFLAKKDNIFYHADSVKEAITGIAKKIKSQKIKNEPLTLNTLMTKNKYAQITGACTKGIKYFCELNELTNKKSMRLGDLLPLIKGYYGYKTIKSLLK